jgi:hypothetical protein
MDKFTAVKVKRWLQECLDTHESCNKAANLCTIWSSDILLIVNAMSHDDKMPRRLLMFSSQDTPNIRVIEIGATNQLIPYVALSHRWGKDESCVATRENLDTLKSTGMNLELLP